MKPRRHKLLVSALAAGVMIVTSADLMALSWQQVAYDYGALQFTKGDAMIDSTYTCTADACRISAANTTSINDITNSASNCPNGAATACAGFTWDNAFFEATDYIGAFDPDAAVKWWQTDDWTLSEGPSSLIDDGSLHHPLAAEISGATITPNAGVTDNATCQAEFGLPGNAAITFDGTADAEGVTFPVCRIDATALGAVTSDVTMTNGVLWLIGNGNLQIGTGDVAGINTKAQGCDGSVPAISGSITISPGTQVFGVQGELGGIVITRGSTIDAQGTSTQPIVMSSADGGVITWNTTFNVVNNNFSGVEEFAGVVLDGCSVVNSQPGGDVASEAVQVGQTRFYGGSEPADSSGIMTFVVIAESGAEFQPDEEVQGLTLEGVGSGTTLDFIQIHYSGDDGIEWFGGTVNAKHLIVDVMNDDGLDMDLGFQGLIQYALVLQADFLGERTIESDNFSDAAPDTLPRTMPTLSNVTLLGAEGDPGKTSTGQLTREGMGGFYDKLLIADRDPSMVNLTYDDGCVDIDSAGTQIQNGDLIWRQSHFNCTAGSGPSVDPLMGDATLENDDDTAALIHPAGNDIVAAILPSARRPDATGSDLASFFGTSINGDQQGGNGTGCAVRPFDAIQGTYLYQTTDATNMLTGSVNTPVAIANAASQNWFFAFDPSTAFAATPVQMQFGCENLRAATSTANLNQPVVGASAGAGLDVIGLVTAVSLGIPLSGAAANASGSANAGTAGGTATVSIDNAAVPDISCSVCQTDGVGACMAPAAATVDISYGAGSTASIGIFCANNGNAVANDPTNNRLLLNFMDGADLVGQTNFDVFTM